MAFGAVLGGVDSWVEVEEFGRDHQAWLARRMALPHGIPSHDPCVRVVARLDPEAFQMGVVAWMQAVHALTAGQVVAVDSQTVRRAHDRGQSPLHWVERLGPGPSPGAGPTGGGRPRPRDRGPAPPVADAGPPRRHRHGRWAPGGSGCPRAVAAQIQAQGGDYVLALKDNLPHLREDVVALLAHVRGTDFRDYAYRTARTVGQGHGRMETRGIGPACRPRIAGPAGAAGS